MKKYFVTVLMFLALILPVRAQEFQAWVKGLEGRGIKVSAGIWELGSGGLPGKLLEGYQTNLGLIPASTTKVISTYAILRSMKPNTVVETDLWGTLAGDTVTGDLVLKGAGDPFLTSERLWLMAKELRGRGIVRVHTPRRGTEPHAARTPRRLSARRYRVRRHDLCRRVRALSWR